MFNLYTPADTVAGKMSGGNMMASFIVMIITYALVYVLAIVMYILLAYGMYTIAKRRGIKAPWLAWVPIADLWTLGAIADHAVGVWKGKKGTLRYWLVVLESIVFLGTVVSVSMILGATLFGIMNYNDPAVADTMIAGGAIFICLLPLIIALAVLEYIALYRLYKSCKPEQAGLFTVLTVLFDVTMPFFVFACRNSDEGLQTPEQIEAPEPEQPE
ncbi:MAG: hypothetical protein IJS31_04370 [Oscillospiraceae bacterium]|nr:hypothetical protein [Oscillospiraceae bacterium]